jgi:hypothetical protein
LSAAEGGLQQNALQIINLIIAPSLPKMPLRNKPQVIQNLENKSQNKRDAFHDLFAENYAIAQNGMGSCPIQERYSLIRPFY